MTDKEMGQIIGALIGMTLSFFPMAAIGMAVWGNRPPLWGPIVLIVGGPTVAAALGFWIGGRAA